MVWHVSATDWISNTSWFSINGQKSQQKTDCSHFNRSKRFSATKCQNPKLEPKSTNQRNPLQPKTPKMTICCQFTIFYNQKAVFGWTFYQPKKWKSVPISVLAFRWISGVCGDPKTDLSEPVEILTFTMFVYAKLVKYFGLGDHKIILSWILVVNWLRILEW